MPLSFSAADFFGFLSFAFAFHFRFSIFAISVISSLSLTFRAAFDYFAGRRFHISPLSASFRFTFRRCRLAFASPFSTFSP